jgi:cyclic pyranopterin monophosphate synthase
VTQGSFSHIDSAGRLRMVDVSSKEPTNRRARASCLVVTTADVAGLPPRSDGLDIIQTARLSGIHAAKLTAMLVPLCHPIDVSDIQVDVATEPRGVTIHSTVATVARTGVEMEALTACLYSALSILDSLRQIDPEARVMDLAVVEKSGGRSG